VIVAGGLQKKMAKDLIGLGGLLVCAKCSAARQITEDQIAKYLGSGWPQHCGQTMTWKTRSQLEAGE
jgi:hypothetical protein